MSDVIVLYNKDAVESGDLIALCEELRRVIAPINLQESDAVSVQLQSSQFAAGYGDIDVCITCSIDDKPEREQAVETLSIAVADYIEQYVDEHGLEDVKTVRASARVAVGKSTFRNLK